MRKILVISDLHCGAITGLTPPKWQTNAAQKTMYNIYKNWVKTQGPYDIVIVNGDAIDGTDRKGQGTECITTDRLEQVEIAYACIRESKCDNVQIIAGTPYHTGEGEDFEKVLADNFNANFKGHGYYNIEGLEFNIKHKQSGSAMPHMKTGPLAREISQNRNWFLEGVEPKADVLIRSHTHYFTQVTSQDCIAFSTPGLQALGNKYGSRQCTSPIHFGLLVLEVDKGRLAWTVSKASGQIQKVKSVKL